MKTSAPDSSSSLTTDKPAASVATAIAQVPPRKARPRKVIEHVLYQDSFDLLRSFSEEMHQEGLTVDTTRMQFDRLYGIERLTEAQQRENDKLRQLAIILTVMYEVRRV